MTVVLIVDYGYIAILKSSSNIILLIFPIFFGDFHKVLCSETDVCFGLQNLNVFIVIVYWYNIYIVEASPQLIIPWGCLI